MYLTHSAESLLLLQLLEREVAQTQNNWMPAQRVSFRCISVVWRIDKGRERGRERENTHALSAPSNGSRRNDMEPGCVVGWLGVGGVDEQCDEPEGQPHCLERLPCGAGGALSCSREMRRFLSTTAEILRSSFVLDQASSVCLTR